MRGTVSGLDGKFTMTLPEPETQVAELKVVHSVAETALHGQPNGVVTFKVKAPAVGGSVTAWLLSV
jgi:hypothetical protein